LVFVTDCRAHDASTAPDLTVEVSSGRSAFFPEVPDQADPLSIHVHDDGSRVWAVPRASDPPVSPRSKEALRLRLYAGLILIDVFCVFAAFVTANAIRFDDPFAVTGLSYSAAILPLFLAVALASGAYSLDALEHPAAGTWKAVRALSLTVVALLIALFLSKYSAAVSRITVAIGFAFAAVAIFVSRRAFGRYAGEFSRWNFVNELVLVDGPQVVLTEGRQTISLHEHGISSSANDPETLERLGKLVQGFDRVLVAAPVENRLSWREMLRGAGIDIELLAPELEQFGAIKVRRSELGPALLVAPGPLGFQERIAKRAFDLIVGTCLLVILAPLMLAIAIAIRLTSSGPILFRQRRLGRANRQFEMLKFRSMYTELCDAAGSCSTGREDDRITPLGHLLRRTSMDELPQLINVLKGEMSLVGPRPHAIASTAENSLFWNIDGRYWHRGAVKPGITGLAQVRGYRGATRTTIDLMNRVNSDLEYLVNWSIWRDVKILVRTASVLAHQNAY
jgi:exopolysaccharide biosynthesis polyprenyl glycosylphosphotransferase